MTAVRTALGAAALWSVALVVGALTLPVYSGDAAGTGSAGATVGSSTGATLVEVNGWWGLALASFPLGASVLVAALLLGPGGRAAQVAAAAVVALLGCLTVLSLLSVGLFLAPAVGGLGLAVLVALTAQPSDAAP